MATAWTTAYTGYGSIVGKIEPEIKVDDTANGRAMNKNDTGIHNHNVGFSIECTCFSCGFVYKAWHPAGTKLDLLITKYARSVCTRCCYIDDRIPTGQNDSNYRFHGVVKIRANDGRVYTISNNTLSGETLNTVDDLAVMSNNKKTKTDDRNLDNAFVSIWDVAPKKKTKLRSEYEEVSFDEEYDLSDDPAD